MEVLLLNPIPSAILLEFLQVEGPCWGLLRAGETIAHPTVERPPNMTKKPNRNRGDGTISRHVGEDNS